MSRNLDILTEREQAVLRAATVLVAGCGSVGGAVVEPLARMGVTETLMRLWLALVEQGYAAQPLLGEFGGLGIPSTKDTSGDSAVLAVLRVGKGTRPPTTRVARCPLATSVKWVE